MEKHLATIPEKPSYIKQGKIMTNKFLFAVLILPILMFSLVSASAVSPAYKMVSNASQDKSILSLQKKLEKGIPIPFVNIGSLIVIPVRINESKELNMILDTGMSAAVIVLFHTEFGEELGLGEGFEVAVAGAGQGETQKARMSVAEQVEISDLVLSQQPVVILNEKREASNWTFDGVIGKSILDSYIVEIDYLSSLLTIYDAKSFSIDHHDQVIPITLERGFPVIEAIIDTETEKESPVKLVVDIGARHTLMFNVNQEKKISFPEQTITSVIGRGVQGELSGKIGRLPKLKIGKIKFSEVITNFSEENANTGIKPSGFIYDGNLGFGILKRFKVVFDYPHHSMYLIPNKASVKPFEFNMMGISFEQRMDKTLYIRDVISDSPASKNDLKKGDVITAINGKKMEEYEYMEIYDLFRDENRSIEISIQRESKQIKVSITLKRLI